MKIERIINPGNLRRLFIPFLIILVFFAVLIFARNFFVKDTRLNIAELSLEELSGEKLDFKSFIGKPIVLNLWATWCAPCRRELPMMANSAKQNPKVHFIFANQKESASQVGDYLSEQNLSIEHVVFDKKGELARKAHSIGLPTTLFFDAKGTLIKTKVGEISSVELFNTLVEMQR